MGRPIERHSRGTDRERACLPWRHEELWLRCGAGCVNPVIHATRRGWVVPAWLRLARQADNSRAVAALLPRLQCGHRMVTVRASSSTATVSSAAQSRHQRCRVTGLTWTCDETHWWIHRPCTWHVSRSSGSSRPASSAWSSAASQCAKAWPAKVRTCPRATRCVIPLSSRPSPTDSASEGERSVFGLLEQHHGDAPSAHHRQRSSSSGADGCPRSNAGRYPMGLFGSRVATRPPWPRWCPTCSRALCRPIAVVGVSCL
jgi:hypothetical protein